MVALVCSLIRNIWAFGLEWGRGISASSAHSVPGSYGRQCGDYHPRTNTRWADRLAKDNAAKPHPLQQQRGAVYCSTYCATGCTHVRRTLTPSEHALTVLRVSIRGQYYI